MNIFGKMFIILGLVFIFLGILFSGKLASLGRLPGDILIEKENFKFYFPITSSLLISLIISLIFIILKNIIK
jgi:hypothetical protein